VPAVEAQLARFQAAHTQVLGVSVDSVYCHANWAKDLGGISFPLLADFHPKGALAAACGAYLEKAGITDRATVIIDSGGVVRHASSVTPAGQRDIAQLAALCEEIDRASTGPKVPFAAGAGLPADAVLYIKSRCGFSRATLLAMDNLHLTGKLPVVNITDDAAAKEALVRLAGKETAPCFVAGGTPMHESKDIIRRLVNATAPL
jgi:glutaredoxin-related protein